MLITIEDLFAEGGERNSGCLTAFKWEENQLRFLHVPFDLPSWEGGFLSGIHVTYLTGIAFWHY
jgi:hypothetical protein